MNEQTGELYEATGEPCSSYLTPFFIFAPFETAELYLVKEIDLEALPNAVITLSIQATQIDNQLRQALSRVDVTVIGEPFESFKLIH